MHEFLVSAAAFIVLVGVMVVVHEFGHFLAAKLCKVRVEAFSIGFGPRLLGFKYGETDYKICLLPLGGYVKMTGETDSALTDMPNEEGLERPANDPGAFTSHPRWQRMLIGVGGPLANFVLTVALMFFYYSFINEVPAATTSNTVLEWVAPGSIAAQAGLQLGDEVTSFDNTKKPDWDQVYEHMKLNAGQPVPVTVTRAGQSVNLTLPVPIEAKGEAFDLSDLGISPELFTGPIGVAQVQVGTPAEQAGLRAGDAIEAVDGKSFHMVNTLIDYMQAGQGKPMVLTILRGGQTLELTATPAKLDTDWKLGFAGKQPPIQMKPLTLPAAWNKSLLFFKSNSLLVGEVLERLFTHRLSITQMAGPVGIARMAGEAAEMDGWLPKFDLAGQISLQLGILNLMPFPILDGGLILFLLIESLLRHDINLVIKERIYQAAFVVLMAFMAFLVLHDVSQLPLFTHMKP